MPTMIKNTPAGFTLLEVMIALVIFSIGLLGLAGLQSAGIRNNQLSYTRTIATQLTYDMGDRIRNNPGINYQAVAAANADCNTVPCNATTMAALDRYEWNAVITDANSPLKNAANFITRTGAAAPFTFTIIVSWNDRGTAVTPNLPNDCTPPNPIPADIACVSLDVTP